VYGGTRSTGTLLITMLDPVEIPSQIPEIPAIWAGAINGLITGSDASILGRLNGLIAQAFDQSPYLSGLSINPLGSVVEVAR